MKTYVARRLLALILVALVVATVAFVVVRASGPGRPGAVHLPAHTAQERDDPHGVLAIALTAALGPSVVNVIVAMAVVYSPRVARVVRGSVLVIRETAYVEAARALGVSDVVLLARHVLPNCMSPVIVQGSLVFAAAVLTEAALSFLGVGYPPACRRGA